MTLKLATHNLSKRFTIAGQSWSVLSELNVQVNVGEFVSIVGPSGCGKSTLLNIVAGVEDPSTGTIAINGSSNGRLGKSGYMTQKPLLLPWKTVRQNVMLGPVIQGQPTAQTKQRANALLNQFGLIEFADEYPHVLSGGMAQKAALLRTILTNSDFTLMDEPFGALDAVTRLAMQLWLVDVMAEFKSTVLCVTHDIREAILLSDRIYVLSHRPGRVIKEVVVDHPRPRDRAFLATKGSVALETELEGLLLGQ